MKLSTRSLSVLPLLVLATFVAVAPASGQPKPIPGQGGRLPLPTVTPVPFTPPTYTAAPGTPPPATPATSIKLRGWVDMHAHPMSHLGFARKLIHGSTDVGGLLPVDAGCVQTPGQRARDMNHALGADNGTHGGPGLDNLCGDEIRKGLIRTLQSMKGAVVTPDRATGAPNFGDWPKWNDITHQKMYVDWVRRARDGGQRVMVGLATNNKTLADGVGSGSDRAFSDDKTSGDLQIEEMKRFARDHSDIMQVATNPAELQSIVLSNRIALVLGVELDTFGNLGAVGGVPATEANVVTELDRLYRNGVRYIFPVHVIDNALGGTAVYEDIFSLSNYRETGSFFSLACGVPGDAITFEHRAPNASPDPGETALKIRLGVDIHRNSPPPPDCGKRDRRFTGHLNSKSLTPLGRFAIREMMRRGMLIDVDHMSQRTLGPVFLLAEELPGGYPLNSGHNGPRGAGGSENSRTTHQYEWIARNQGMIGLGTEAADAAEWGVLAASVALSTRGRPVALGTDLNGLVRAPKPPVGRRITYGARISRSTTGSKTWDYNTDGVAHYGMLWDFLEDVRTSGGEASYNLVMDSADAFHKMWQRAETQKRLVR